MDINIILIINWLKIFNLDIFNDSNIVIFFFLVFIYKKSNNEIIIFVNINELINNLFEIE